MVSVYVSYAWKEEAQKPLVARLAEACAARGIELRYDRKEMRYGDSISQFMKRIGAAEHIVLVLSAAYFKSDYCMDELCQIYARGHFRKRVSPIVLAGTSFHKPKDGIGYLQHWEQQIAELRNGLGALDSREHTQRSQTALEHYREFRGMMEELQGILADMNTLSEDEHLESGFAAVLDRILAGSTASKPDPFRQQLVAEIQKTLAAPSSAELVKALQNKIADARVAPGDDLAKCLCDGDPERAIEDLLFPATRNALLPLDEPSGDTPPAVDSDNPALVSDGGAGNGIALTEAIEAQRAGKAVDSVRLPPEDSMRDDVAYAICAVGKGPRAQAAARYLAFLATPEAQAAYAKFGFVNASAQSLALKPIP